MSDKFRSVRLVSVEQHGFILIADITGYTGYLSRSEIDHAQGTLTDLLELLVEHTRPPLVVSRLEGDAVISYGLSDGFVSGQTFLESIEDTYIAFRRAIELMVLNNTCRCNACANVSSLDLKFFVHYGSFVLQRLGDHEEMLGSDVNLIHRLLKNTVTDQTGIRAYILCTAAAVGALGIGEATGGMVRHTEAVPDFGEIQVWVQDMHPIYEERRDEEQITFDPKEVVAVVETEISMPPEVVWDYLGRPEFRRVITHADHMELTDTKAGRIAPGTTFQCYHGNLVVPFVVLEWRPFERFVSRDRWATRRIEAYAHTEYRLERTEKGTRLTMTCARVTGQLLARLLIPLMATYIRKGLQDGLDSFRDVIERDFRARQATTPSLAPITMEQISAEAAAALERSE